MKIIDVPHSFEELRSSVYGHQLSPLIEHLSSDVHHQAILPALLGLRGHFRALDEDDDRRLNLTRAYACEIVAWRFTTYLSEQEAIDYLLYDLPDLRKESIARVDEEANGSSGHRRQSALFGDDGEANEHSQLLGPKRDRTDPPTMTSGALDTVDEDVFSGLARSFAGLNALEIATVTDAKKFLSQKAVQKILHDIWKGDIVFWETLSVSSKKKPRKWNKRFVEDNSPLPYPKIVSSSPHTDTSTVAWIRTVGFVCPDISRYTRCSSSLFSSAFIMLFSLIGVWITSQSRKSYYYSGL